MITPDLARMFTRYKAWADEITFTSVAALPEGELGEMIEVQFVGGGPGAMTRGEILLHLVNHGTYHRGFVSDMMNQVKVNPPPSDLTVYLRDVHRAAT